MFLRRAGIKTTKIEVTINVSIPILSRWRLLMIPLHDLLSKRQLVLELQDLRMIAILYAGIVALVPVLIPIPADG